MNINPADAVIKPPGITDPMAVTRRSYSYATLARIWSWLKTHITVIALAFVSLICFLSVNWQVGQGGKANWLAEHSRQAIGTALLAWFYALFYLITVALCGALYLFVWERNRASRLIMTIAGIIIYLIFTISALMPISLVLYELQSMGLSLSATYFSTLLFVNGLFLYLGINFMAQIKEEMQRTYVISAQFKSSSRSKFMTESLTHFLLSSFSAVYYFIITFTLVPELLTGGHGSNTWFHHLFGTSIVYDLFVTVLETGFSEPRFWSLFFAFILFVLLVRLLLIDTVLRWWEGRHGIEHN